MVLYIPVCGQKCTEVHMSEQAKKVRMTFYIPERECEFIRVVSETAGGSQSAALSLLLKSILSEDFKQLSLLVEKFNRRRQF